MHSETLPQWNCEYTLFDFSSNEMNHGVFYFLILLIVVYFYKRKNM